MDIDQKPFQFGVVPPPETGVTSAGKVHAARVEQIFAFLIIDRSGIVHFCSPDAHRLLGMEDKALIGQSVSSFFPAPVLQSVVSSFSQNFTGTELGNERWQKFDAHNTAAEIRFTRLELAGKSFIALELRPSHLLPGQALLKLMQALDASGEMAAITNTAGEIEYVNPIFERLTGYRKAELLGRTHDLIGADRSPELYAQMWATLRTGKPFHGAFINQSKNGQVFHEDRYIRPFIDDHGRATHFVFSGRDVSERERAIGRLKHLANHDGLTGLPNRNLFIDRLRQATIQAVRRHSGFSLLLLDLDNFKAVNDKFGHAVGDALLTAVGTRLRNCVREEDTVARIGGDEFAIILSGAALPVAALTALEKISLSLRQPHVIEGNKLPSNASIGVAFYPEDSVGMDTLLKFADIAMYRAKNAGGNRYHFHRQRGAKRLNLGSLMLRNLAT